MSYFFSNNFFSTFQLASFSYFYFVIVFSAGQFSQSRTCLRTHIMLKEEAGSSVSLSVKTSVPWLIFLTRQLQRGRVVTVETRSEGDDKT